MSYQLGVDIGTTFTTAAVARDGRVAPAELGSHSLDIPSVAFVTEEGATLVGEGAERRGALQPDRLVRDFKRRVGDPVPMSIGTARVAAPALMRAVLSWVVDTVSAHELGPPDAVVVTYPASWRPDQRDQFGRAVHAVTGDAHLVAEAEAAAAWFGASRPMAPGETIAVYDLGGATFQATVLRRVDAGFAILGTPGFQRIGGADFDEAVLGHVQQTLGPALDDLDFADPVVAAQLARLRSECVAAKEALSFDHEVTIPVLLGDQRRQVRLRRDELEAMIGPGIDQTMDLMLTTVERAGLSPATVDQVVLVGGSSRIPLVEHLVTVGFGRPPALDRQPQENVALGAALLGAARMGAQLPLPPVAVAPEPMPEPTPEPMPDPAPEPLPPPPASERPAARMPAPVAATAEPPPSDAWPAAIADAAQPGPPGRRSAKPALLLIPAALLLVIGLVLLVTRLVGDPDAEATASGQSGGTATPTPTAPATGWRSEASYPTTIEAASAAAWGGRIWVAGGNNSSADRPLTAAVYSYDPAKAAEGWTAGPTLPGKMDHMTLVSNGKSLYVIGGNDGKQILRTVYRLDRPDGRWVKDTPLPKARQAGAALWDPFWGRIVYAGGEGPGRRSGAEVWSFDSKRWKLLGTLKRARNHLAAATDGHGRVYFVGGENGGNQKGRVYGDMDVLDGEELSVERGVQARRAHGAVVVPDQGLCVFGGVEGRTWRADFTCQRKAGIGPLSPPRAGFATAELDGRLYVIGGYTPDRPASDIVQSLAVGQQ